MTNSNSADLHNSDFILIGPKRLISSYMREVWLHRDLILFLIQRDLRLRYKHTALGFLWAVIRPLINVMILAIVFGHLASRQETMSIPHWLFVTVAVLPWQIVVAALVDGSMIVVNNAHIISKVYFPKAVLPLSSLGVAFADFILQMALLIPLLVVWGPSLGWSLLFLPVYIVITLFLAGGISLLSAASTVRFRDLKHVYPILAQLGLFIAPIGYSLMSIPINYQSLLLCNPVTGIILGFRYALLNENTEVLLFSGVISSLFAAFFCITGIAIFSIYDGILSDEA